MYTFNCLDNFFAAIAYQPFTFPLYRSRLQAIKFTPSTVAIAAADAANQPIGLALAEIRPDGQSVEVLSIFVKPIYRQQGVGTALFNRLAAELRRRGCTTAHLVYTSGQPTTLALERMLQKGNWTSPQPRMLVCKTSLDRIVQAPWMQRSALPSSYQICRWTEVTPAERFDIQQRQKLLSWIPPDLVPFHYEQNLEPLNSLGLRYQGQVVGWMITHRLAPDTIRYTCSFVREDLQKMGRISPLYVNAIQAQNQMNIAKGIWTVPFCHASMVQFVKKRMASYMNELEETRSSYQRLEPV